MESARERVLKAVNHEPPEMTPVNISNFYDRERWQQHYGAADALDLRRKMGLDLQYARPVYTGKYAEKNLSMYGTPIEGVFGADGSGYGKARGCFPLADVETVQEVENFDWPDPDDFDYEAAATVLKGLPDDVAKRVDGKYGIAQAGKPNHECQSGPWLPLICTLFDLYGLDNACMKLAMEPRVMHATVAKIEEFMLEFIRRTCEAAEGLADFFFIGDDFATQNGLMISPEYWRKYLGPVWETVQVHLAGNDPAMLKREFGDDITFHGAICTQHTLPHGTQEEVRAEVRDRINVLGEGGGYICAPDHGVMPDVPVENIEAFLEEVRKGGPGPSKA